MEKLEVWESQVFKQHMKKIEQRTIQVFRHFEPTKGYYLAFSGGKDSIVLKYLADQAEVLYDAHYNVTTIDPPEIVYFIRKYYPDVAFDYPEEPFLRKLVKHGFPMRTKRWCCEHYKERWGANRFVLTGIRQGESRYRKSRGVFEHCLKGGYKGRNKHFVNPLFNWTENEIWHCIKNHCLSYPILYDEGWKRVGCLFCPNAGKRMRELHRKRYPGFEKAFVKAFEKLYEDRKSRGLTSVDRWASGKEMFEWWIAG